VDSVIIGVDIDRELRREKITRRLKVRLEEGMVEEVKALLDEGIPADDLIYYGLEYKFVTEYLTGEITYDEMFTRLEIAIHQFAKRQMTWFRGMERRGFEIHWIDTTLPMEEKVFQILQIVNCKSVNHKS
jgi:tRNA dimethylallyltransferase